MDETRSRGPEGIYPALMEAIVAERRGTLIFSLITLVLTPFFCLALIALILVGLAIIGLQGGAMPESMATGVRLATGINLVMAYVLAAFFGSPKERGGLTGSDLGWIAGALSIFGGLIFLTYATNLPDHRPGLFWLTYALAAPVMLAMLGRAFMPKDPHYLGWYESISGDTSGEETLSNSMSDFFRFAAFLPAIVLECYGQIFGSFWLWRRLESSETRLMVETLLSLESDDLAGARARLQLAPKSSAADVIRWLSKLGFVRIRRGGLVLTPEESDFIAAGRVN